MTSSCDLTDREFAKLVLLLKERLGPVKKQTARPKRVLSMAGERTDERAVVSRIMEGECEVAPSHLLPALAKEAGRGRKTAAAP